MAIEIIKESDPMKATAWDRIHDKRKLYRCERCGCEWRCEYSENKFGSSHEFNGDPDILCQRCGHPTVKEVVLREIPEAVSSYRGCKDFDHDDYNCLDCANPEKKSCFKCLCYRVRSEGVI
jgi:hypothetical protein